MTGTQTSQAPPRLSAKERVQREARKVPLLSHWIGDAQHELQPHKKRRRFDAQASLPAVVAAVAVAAVARSRPFYSKSLTIWRSSCVPGR